MVHVEETVRIFLFLLPESFSITKIQIQKGKKKANIYLGSTKAHGY